jgi:hypothetical protein
MRTSERRKEEEEDLLRRFQNNNIIIIGEERRKWHEKGVYLQLLEVMCFLFFAFKEI